MANSSSFWPGRPLLRAMINPHSSSTFSIETPQQYDRLRKAQALGYVTHCLKRDPYFEPHLLKMIGSLLDTCFGPVGTTVTAKSTEYAMVREMSYEVRLGDEVRDYTLKLGEDTVALYDEDDDEILRILGKYPEYPQFNQASYMEHAVWWNFIPYMARQQTRYIEYLLKEKEEELKADRARFISRKRKFE